MDKLNSFYNSLNQIKEEYEKLKKRNIELKNQLDEWNKDDEIVKLKKELYESYRIPARIMNQIRKVEDEHYNETKNKNKDQLLKFNKIDFSGGHLDTSIIITQTHLDDNIQCVCNKCKKILGEWWV